MALHPKNSLSAPSVRNLATLAGSTAILLSLLASAASAAVPPVPVPAGNPITQPKGVLGKMLFWDEQMSTSMVVSCGTCHIPGRAGSDPRVAQHPGADNILGNGDDVTGSPGVIKSDSNNKFLRDAIYALRPQVTGRAAQPNIDSAYAPQLFWDGRATGEFRDPMTNAVILPTGGALENQAIGPILNSIEMSHAGQTWTNAADRLKRVQPLALSNAQPADVAAALADKPNYPELFRRAFGTAEITPARIAMAIATYQRTLISDQTPLDRTQAGQPGGLTQQQINGMNAFAGSNCVACHAFNRPNSPATAGLFTDFTFRNIGLRPPAQDLGRSLISGDNDDRGKFKVPGLRNVGLKRTFMHNGQFNTLAQVIGFYAGAPNRVGDNIDPVMQTVRIPPPTPGSPPGTGAGADIAEFLANGLLDTRVRDQVFPFDKPTLFADRPADQAVLLGGAVAPAGQANPLIVVQSPPLIGNLDYRVGLDVPAVLAGFNATLAISTSPPVNGRIVPTETKGTLSIVGHVDGANATVSWALTPGSVAPGQVVFLQWLIPSPTAPNGEARSGVARVTFFCGSLGCPPRCFADYDGSQATTVNDLFAYLAAWFNSSARADSNGNGTVAVDDIFNFLTLWFQGC